MSSTMRLAAGSGGVGRSRGGGQLRHDPLDLRQDLRLRARVAKALELRPVALQPALLLLGEDEGRADVLRLVGRLLELGEDRPGRGGRVPRATRRRMVFRLLSSAAASNCSLSRKVKSARSKSLNTLRIP